MQFTQGLHRAVQQHPHGIATRHGERTQTFLQLKQRVSKLAGALAMHGVQKGDRIAILSLNSDRYLEAYLAIAWLGAAVNPINFRWSNDEIIYSLNDSSSSALIIDDYFSQKAGDILAGAPSLRSVFYNGDHIAPNKTVNLNQLIDAAIPIDDAQASGDDLLGVFYTGGTTGAPKGVMLSHANVFSSAMALLAEGVFGEGAVGLHAAPMFHLADMMTTMALLIRGGSHVFLSAFDPEAVLQLVEQHQLTDLLLVPAMLQSVVGAAEACKSDSSSVKNIIYGASPASETLLDRTMKIIPSANLTQVYGMTEMSAVMAVLPADMHRPKQRHLGRLRSGGRAALHVQTRVVGANDQELPRGEIGEIIARGPSMMKGYLNKIDATKEALINGWMHTGDMGYMDDEGYIFIVDRLKDMIISGGENVYCAEVENIVCKHPAVASCAVIGIPCEKMGEQVHAVVVLHPDNSLTQDQLYEHCKSHIAGYKCPRSMQVIDALPMSGAGKVLKTELRQPFWTGRDRSVS
ncbi:long-chain fatty acid--CoA ligase [Spongiibacter taiwanensis]